MTIIITFTIAPPSPDPASWCSTHHKWTQEDLDLTKMWFLRISSRCYSASLSWCCVVWLTQHVLVCRHYFLVVHGTFLSLGELIALFWSFICVDVIIARTLFHSSTCRPLDLCFIWWVVKSASRSTRPTIGWQHQDCHFFWTRPRCSDCWSCQWGWS